ncbi:MAG: ATP-dependent zinc metalloprotease FtsH [Bacteroidia bacterium]
MAENNSKKIPPNKNDTENPRKGISLINWIYLGFILVLGFFFFYPSLSNNAQEITWQNFEQNMLQTNDVDRIEVVNNEIAQVYIKPESLKKDKFKKITEKKFVNIANNGPQYFLRIGSVDVLEKKLDDAQVNIPEAQRIPVKYVKQENWFIDSLGWILPIILLIVFWQFLFRRIGTNIGNAGSSIFNFGKTRAVMVDKGAKSQITFKDVAGYDEAKVEVMEIVDFLKKPEDFTSLGAKILRGVLLIGPPGTGKTLMAKAVAGEANVPFFSLSGPEFIEMFVGVGASRVRDLFEKAKQKAPSIIFIDEIDTIGRRRGRAISLQTDDERESTLNQLLSEMDGFDESTGVIVLAATNRADILDPALVRPGRFDRHIYLELPNKKEREAIFKVHMQPLKYDAGSVNVELLAAETPGFSGADIANVCNEAALIAARLKKKLIDAKDFNEAIDKVVAGTEKKTMAITPEEKRIISYHEAGHAIVGWMLKNVDPLIKVSIIPRGKSLGSSWYLPEEKKIITRAKFYDELCASLGGRAAEDIQFHEISSGAVDDLEKVTKQAYSMVTILGLNDKVGNISYYDSTGLQDQTFQKPYSEATGQMIDEEVRKMVSEAYTKTKKILEEKKDKLDKLAKLLQEKEVVFKEDLESILGKRDSN